MTLKRFLLFAGGSYYPNGGWLDFVGSYDTFPEAEKAVPDRDWAQVVDTQEGLLWHGDIHLDETLTVSWDDPRSASISEET